MMAKKKTTKSNIVDFTKMRKGTKTDRGTIDYCPKCGRKGQKTVYEQGFRNPKYPSGFAPGFTEFNHKAKIVMGFLLIDDHCHIAAILEE